MMTTSSPAKATAAIVAIAYSAVAAPDSSVNSDAARCRVSGGTAVAANGGEKSGLVIVFPFVHCQIVLLVGNLPRRTTRPAAAGTVSEPAG